MIPAAALCLSLKIDALATVRPDIPFFDHDLDDRAEEVERDWEKDAQQILEDQLDHELLDRTRREAEEKLAGVRTEIVKLNEALRTAAADLDLIVSRLRSPS